MTEAVHIRWAEPDDAAAVAAINVRAWQTAYRGIMPDDVLDGLSVEDRARRQWKRIVGDGERVAVAEAAGRVVGFVGFGPPRDDDKPADRTGEVYAIYVDPPHWRLGIGSALLGSAEGELIAAGKREIVLWTLEGNPASRAFYAARGYRPDGARKTIKIADLPAVRYTKALAGP